VRSPAQVVGGGEIAIVIENEVRSPNQVAWEGAIVIENQVRSPNKAVLGGAIAIIIENEVRSLLCTFKKILDCTLAGTSILTIIGRRKLQI
jgi:hypothetical protein